MNTKAQLDSPSVQSCKKAELSYTERNVSVHLLQSEEHEYQVEVA